VEKLVLLTIVVSSSAVFAIATDAASIAMKRFYSERTEPLQQ
jgi:hypothetical protein